MNYLNQLVKRVDPEILKKYFFIHNGIIYWKCDSPGKQKKAGSRAGSIVGSKKYKRVELSIFGKRLNGARVAWVLYYGDWPNGIIDHINRNPLDNRQENLRDTDFQTNNRNRGHKYANGVAWNRFSKSFMAYRISCKRGENKHLGYFKTEKEAKAAVDRDLKERGLK